MGWSWRELTLLRKIQVIKSFAIPKILYRVVLISNKKEFIKKINSLLYSFVWKGKDKIKRTAFINPIDKGGLKMPNIESMISALITYGAKLLNADWLRQRAFFLNHEGTFW